MKYPGKWKGHMTSDEILNKENARVVKSHKQYLLKLKRENSIAARAYAIAIEGDTIRNIKEMSL